MFFADPRFWQYVTTLLPFLLCLIFYGLRSPWRDSPVGQALMTLYASLVAVLAYAVLAIAGVVPAALHAVLRVVLLGGVAVAGWVHFANIVRLQREARRERKTITEEIR